MYEEAPLELTLASFAELWREIAVYLEIWDLIRTEALLARVPNGHHAARVARRDSSSP
jgi:hypothetical protein